MDVSHPVGIGKLQDEDNSQHGKTLNDQQDINKTSRSTTATTSSDEAQESNFWFGIRGNSKSFHPNSIPDDM